MCRTALGRSLTMVVLLVAGVTALPSPSREGLAGNAPPEARPDPLGPGDHTRTLVVGEQMRTYLVHVPPKYDAKSPAPVVLALHGAAMNGPMMAGFCGLNPKADEAGFVVVYPSETGPNLL